jgi:hypothetical protein
LEHKCELTKPNWQVAPEQAAAKATCASAELSLSPLFSIPNKSAILLQTGGLLLAHGLHY